MAQEQCRRNVDIFWDLGSCPASANTSGHTVANRVRTLALRLGIVKSFKAYLSISAHNSHIRELTLRSELHSSGVSLIDAPGKKEIADKMLIVDMLTHALDRNSEKDSNIIMLIAGNPSFSYLLSILRMRNHRVVVLGPRVCPDDYLNNSVSFASQANLWLDWDTEIMDKVRVAVPRSSATGGLGNSNSQALENLNPTPAADTESERTSETVGKPASVPPFDAVLNSPVEPHNPSLVSPLASPSLTGRATDLSVLDSGPPALPERTAPSRSSSPSSSSQIQPPPCPSPVQESARSPTVCSNSSQQLDDQGPPPSSSSSTAHKQSDGLIGDHERHTGTSSPSMSPPPFRSGSVTVPSEMEVGITRHSTSTYASSSIPYRPTKRITPAGSVTIPLSQQEIETFRTFQGQGAMRLAAKRKRSGSEDYSERPVKSSLGGSEVAVEYFNSRPDVGVVRRQESPIIGLKCFNNWVKSVLIARFAHPVLQKSSLSSHGQGRRGEGRGKVLDMGCGKGGDITKWSKARIKELLCVDNAAVSVEQARSRYQSMASSRFEASFAALDWNTEPLAKAFSSAKLSTQFDVVSMQFRMQYAFETLEKTRIMLDNVSRYLIPGGVFIGTIPNGELLMQELDALPPDADDLTFGNNVYKIRFEQREPRPLFGHKYWFFLQDAVEDVPEYVVHWDNLVELAAEYGLYPTYKEEFHQVFDEHQSKDEFRQLMVRMKVINSEGESSMSEDEWEAANIYIAFAFEKR